jgi:hypothetical protein
VPLILKKSKQPTITIANSPFTAGNGGGSLGLMTPKVCLKNPIKVLD